MKVDLRDSSALVLDRCQLHLHAVHAIDTVHEQYQDEDEGYLQLRVSACFFRGRVLECVPSFHIGP